MKPESASGIGKARGCLRKWAFGYMDGIWPPHTDANQVGTRIHAMQEAYLKTGVVPHWESDQLFRLALPHLPSPGNPGLMLEQKDTCTLFGRQHVVVIDIEWCDELGFIHLYDHKTSKHGARFALKTREAYLDDVQFVLYATYLFHKYPSAATLEGKWIYYRTPPGKPAVYAFPHLFGRDEIYDAYHRVVAPTTDKLVGIRKKGLRAADVQANMDHCGEYGGCYYLGSHCNPMESESDMSDLDDLFGEFSAPKTTPKVESKLDLINPPEKAKMSVKEAVKATENAIDALTAPSTVAGKVATLNELAETTKPADVQQQQPEYGTYSLHALCDELDRKATFVVLKALALKLLGG